MAKDFEHADMEGDVVIAYREDDPRRCHVILTVRPDGSDVAGSSVYLYSHEMRDLAKWLNVTADEIDGEREVK